MCVIVPGRDGGSPGTLPGWPPPVCSSLLVSAETAWLMVCHHECGSALTELFQLYVNVLLLLSQENSLEHWLHGKMSNHGIETKWFGWCILRNLFQWFVKWGLWWSLFQICHCPLKRHNVTAGHQWHLETGDSYHQERWYCSKLTHHFNLQWHNPPCILNKWRILAHNLQKKKKTIQFKWSPHSFPVYRATWALMGFCSLSILHSKIMLLSLRSAGYMFCFK